MKDRIAPILIAVCIILASLGFVWMIVANADDPEFRLMECREVTREDFRTAIFPPTCRLVPDATGGSLKFDLDSCFGPEEKT